MTDLKPLPCLFCGSEARKSLSNAGGGRIKCSNLSCKVSHITMPAIVWNDRATVQGVPDADAIRSEYNRAIDFALEQGLECETFLRCWREGDTAEWPEFNKPATLDDGGKGTTPTEQALSALKARNLSPCRGLFIHSRHFKAIIEALELKISVDEKTATR